MFHIKDWAGNILFNGQTFDTFEDGWDFIFEQDHLEEDDYQELYVLEIGA